MVHRFATALAVLALIGCSSASAFHLETRPHAATSHTLVALVNSPVPGRNLYVLADDFTVRPPRPIPHVLRTTSPNFPVGHQDAFWVLGEDKLAYFRMTATIQVKTPHVYLYVQNGAKFDATAVRRATLLFERHTYPTDRALYGSEWRPGVDGDPHLTILLGDLRSSATAGYFSAEDEYPPIVHRFSNAREMFYINLANTTPGSAEFNYTLAHEFQHMIHFHVHPRDNAWMNEGMSMLAQRVNGYPNSVVGEVGSFLPLPGTQLNTWNASGDNSSHYGASFLFLAYLYDHYGRSVIHDLVADRKLVDLALVNDVLRRHHIPLTADDIFGNWIVANYLGDSTPGHGKFSYVDLPDKVTPAQASSLPFKVQGDLPPYATRYVEIAKVEGQKPFRLQFSAPSTVPLVGLPGNSPYWWSNRGDLIDTSLARNLDLTGVHRAHLHYQVWWDIEKNYDYGYVEASIDGGRTWTTLAANGSTSTNPTGANYGHGYTGEGNGWHDVNVNLARYAGHHVTLRFEYITDDATNLQGMALRHIGIPEIGFADDFSGWQPHGFLPVAQNALPSSWHVRLIEYTARGVRVKNMSLDASKRGSIVIDPTGLQLKRLAVAIFTTAPKTTVKTTYHLSAAPIG